MKAGAAAGAELACEGPKAKFGVAAAVVGAAAGAACWAVLWPKLKAAAVLWGVAVGALPACSCCVGAPKEKGVVLAAPD